MITFTVEGKECIQDIIDMCELWWYDSLFYETHGVKYSPDKAMYETLMDLGICFALCGRSETGKLVACYVSMLTPYQFNPQILMSSEVVWCVHPDHQKSSILFRLLISMEKELIARNVNFTSLAVPNIDKYQGLQKRIEKQGFTYMDNMYIKEMING